MDYYSKSVEFRAWLKDVRGMFLSEMETAKAKEIFEEFLQLWNDGNLPSKYYAGMSSSTQEASTRTSYSWSFSGQGIDDLQRGTLRDTIERDTNRSMIGKEAHSSASSSTSSASSSKAPGPSRPTGSSHHHHDGEDMDEEDRARYGRALQKKKERDYRSTKDAALEELVPKATGRDAQLEKKRAQRDYHKKKVTAPWGSFVAKFAPLYSTPSCTGRFT
eukprot:TRINITY_DN9952_c0_g1_i1.p1 TRINITY_DN9952_c0_g1~~TRINITY_DN9952_c0_g1_i1.p1  ORF type:complete len:218 (-),score=67.31 TRINITY_DN9952_c0_g1_i1:153-806(-)